MVFTHHIRVAAAAVVVLVVVLVILIVAADVTVAIEGSGRASMMVSVWLKYTMYLSDGFGHGRNLSTSIVLVMSVRLIVREEAMRNLGEPIMCHRDKACVITRLAIPDRVALKKGKKMSEQIHLIRYYLFLKVSNSSCPF